MTARRVIVHMDCDAFYASVELMRRPDLRGKPVVVAGSGPRAVVTTASYEARRYGIGSAMAASRARRLCPQAIFIPPDHTAYRAKSNEVWEFVRAQLGCPLQQVSVDEAYAEITHEAKPVTLMRGVVAETRRRTGIMISVGIGPSRLVAKTASDARKPSGFVVLSREQACEHFAHESPRLLQGVGPKTVERLLALGIADIHALREADAKRLSEHFGSRMATFLIDRAHFHDDSPVVTERIARSHSSERTFDEDVSNPEVLEETTRKLALNVCEALGSRGVRGRTIAIKVRLDDWTNVTRARTIDSFTNEAELVARIALELLRDYAPPRPVRLLGVRVASFEKAGNATANVHLATQQLALEV